MLCTDACSDLRTTIRKHCLPKLYDHLTVTLIGEFKKFWRVHNFAEKYCCRNYFWLVVILFLKLCPQKSLTCTDRRGNRTDNVQEALTIGQVIEVSRFISTSSTKALNHMP